jgi:adenine phosphoribosyltransferase
MLRIMIGSSSQMKFWAVWQALHDLDVLRLELRGPDIPSGVPSQPCGDQTREGAMNRARGAQERQAGSWGLGIENGLFYEDGEWRDAAVIVLISPEARVYEIRSEYIVFPADVVEEARRRGFAKTTAGSVLAERTGCDGADPHAYLTAGKKPRAKYLEEALVKLFERAFNAKKEVTVSRVHEVQVGSLTLELPVVEVAPGISVALFNSLGDWKVNEEAGKALAAKFKTPVDALVMPDGKAQALLHVIGRELKLPTVVARKEKKPYMGDCVSVAVKTMTTSNRVQTLYMAAADAEMLRGKRVAVVDDVVSTGASLNAMKELLANAGAEYMGTLAVFTEGPDERPDVISLANLPLF